MAPREQEQLASERKIIAYRPRLGKKAMNQIHKTSTLAKVKSIHCSRGRSDLLALEKRLTILTSGETFLIENIMSNNRHVA
ncbi:hypothetical protein GE061_002528 [Apolygus lucorum]|uniref:Uncharacterized protein n=1 Tax=Apolygus lucorum TaxID=248454 RepID=A0A8S9X756_APOLU|nr:hypothetical protein GE061_002528 [Apolygus lucorum]